MTAGEPNQINPFDLKCLDIIETPIYGTWWSWLTRRPTGWAVTYYFDMLS